MDWVFAGSKHEARNFMEENRDRYSWGRVLDSVRILGRTQLRGTSSVIHVVGTALYRKDAQQVLEAANTYNIIVVDHTTHGVVTAPSLEIAHVYYESLGISPEWRYEGTERDSRGVSTPR